MGRFLRISPRLVVALGVGVTLVSVLTAVRDVTGHVAQAREQAAARAAAEAHGFEPALVPLLERRSAAPLDALLDEFQRGSHLAGAVIVDRDGAVLASTPNLSPELLAHAQSWALDAGGQGEFFSTNGAYLHVYADPINRAGARLGTLVALHDAQSVADERWRLWRDAFVTVIVQTGAILLLTVVLVRWSVIRPIAKTAAWLRELRLGEAVRVPLESELFTPLMNEVTHLVASLETARAAAQEEARLRDAGASVWTAERLRAHVQAKMNGRPLFVVSNREPYMHVGRHGESQVLVPASGLVTALEPILRACDGTWIAHGSGNADRDHVDACDRLRVPPNQPEYTLRRVWLTPDEEDGYYYGFSNEGLWPLCHIAHTRPLFRATDWANYERANRKFAAAVIEEMAGAPGGTVLVQDYHFALLPQLIKAARPDARVAIFWHIPWPNPEAFAICPWQRELIDGLLGADLIGFHTQAHCNNFLETVDRAFESKIEWEHFTARRHDHVTHVRPFPISVASHDRAAGVAVPSQPSLRAEVLREMGVSARLMGVGVDRVDYTKGIVERFHAIERFLERWPAYIGVFTFVQVGAPSRTQLKRYQDLVAEVEAEARRINARFQTADWKPIIERTRHHSHAEIERFYRAADLCLVTSLHDGMNLVAKEFVAARDDEDGVLVLSQFAGASGELHDALIVNPYDTEQLAGALRLALEMPDDDRRDRMRRMRQTAQEHNVYRWAGMLIADLAAIRVEAPLRSAAVISPEPVVSVA